MLKAAMVTPDLSLVGAARWLVDLIKFTHPDKIRWTGVAVSGYGGVNKMLAAELHELGIYIHVQHSKDRPPHAKPLDLTYVHQENHGDFHNTVGCVAGSADVIVTWGSVDCKHWLPPNWGDKPVVCVAHQSKRQTRPINGPTHLVAVSNKAVEFFPDPQMPVKVIHNGVDSRRCAYSTTTRPEFRKKCYINDDDVVVGFIGRQTNDKRPQLVAEAVKILNRDCGKTQLLLVGEGPQCKEINYELMSWCEDNIQRDFYVAEPVRQIGDVYNAIDVVVMPSESEACSLTLLECWMAGVPVVSTRTGCIPEVELLYSRPPVFALPDDPTPQDIVDGVLDAVYPKKCDRLVSMCRKIAHNHFTVEKMAEQWQYYLEGICG